MDVEQFEAERWEDEGWELRRDAYVNRLKGQHAQLTNRRLANYQWALSLVDQVRDAYAALDCDVGERVGGKRLAEQLSLQGVLTQNKTKPTTHSDCGKAWADALVSEIDASLIDEAVLECRTLMTARCLSADFEAEKMGELEAEYIEFIADALALGRALRNQVQLPRGKLLDDARHEALLAAQRQRRDKPPVSMAVRERYWRDRPAPVRKVFEGQL